MVLREYLIIFPLFNLSHTIDYQYYYPIYHMVTNKTLSLSLSLSNIKFGSLFQLFFTMYNFIYLKLKLILQFC